MNFREIAKVSKDLTFLMQACKKHYFSFKRKSIINKYFQENQKNFKLHLGCGNNVLKGWLNADLFLSKEVIYLDITNKFPFPDCSFNYVLAEHTVEHIEYMQATIMLQEIFRVLKNGGVARIATPSLDKYLKVYINNHDMFENKICETMTNDWIRSGFYKATNYIPQKDDKDKSFFINDIFMNYEHKFIYNEATLIKLFKNAGFRQTQVCKPGCSSYKELNNIETHIDDINSYLTLTVEGVKP